MLKRSKILSKHRKMETAIYSPQINVMLRCFREGMNNAKTEITSPKMSCLNDKTMEVKTDSKHESGEITSPAPRSRVVLPVGLGRVSAFQ